LIDWTSFTWEAFATLLVGLIAVWVARKQMQINRQQKGLAERQIELSRFDRQIALFDRDLCFTATVDNDWPPDEIDRRMREAAAVAPFLFDEDIAELMRAIVRRISGLRSACGYVRDGLATRNMSPELERQFLEAVEKQRERRLWYRETLETLPNRFAPYLRLSEPLASKEIEKPSPAP
jgi:hypothetical protein